MIVDTLDVSSSIFVGCSFSHKNSRRAIRSRPWARIVSLKKSKNSASFSCADRFPNRIKSSMLWESYWILWSKEVFQISINFTFYFQSVFVVCPSIMEFNSVDSNSSIEEWRRSVDKTLKYYKDKIKHTKATHKTRIRNSTIQWQREKRVLNNKIKSLQNKNEELQESFNEFSSLSPSIQLTKHCTDSMTDIQTEIRFEKRDPISSTQIEAGWTTETTEEPRGIRERGRDRARDCLLRWRRRQRRR